MEERKKESTKVNVSYLLLYSDATFRYKRIVCFIRFILYYCGNFKRGAPEGWIPLTWGAEGLPSENGLIEAKWYQKGSAAGDWVSWSESASGDTARSSSEESP